MFKTNKVVGDCYFCGKPVYASPGQALKVIKGRKDPYTHKVCRKNERYPNKSR